MILSRTAELGKKIDKSVFPGFQGGPIMQMIAAKAVAFGEALKPEFRDYAHQIIKNSQHLATFFMNHGTKLITNGTDNHLMLIDSITSWDIPGGEVEAVLDKVGITLNKNIIPNDQRKPMDRFRRPPRHSRDHHPRHEGERYGNARRFHPPAPSRNGRTRAP